MLCAVSPCKAHLARSIGRMLQEHLLQSILLRQQSIFSQHQVTASV